MALLFYVLLCKDSHGGMNSILLNIYINVRAKIKTNAWLIDKRGP